MTSPYYCPECGHNHQGAPCPWDSSPPARPPQLQSTTNQGSDALGLPDSIPMRATEEAMCTMSVEKITVGAIVPDVEQPALVADGFLGGGRCETCGQWCPSLADLAEHYAPTVGITPRTPCQTRPLATSGHRADSAAS